MAVKPPHTWYVSFEQRKVRPLRRAFLRTTVTFRSEVEAKGFAKQKFAEADNVTAGTLNPYVPKRVISPAQIARWLEEV
jgi:hypothetical protein